MSEKVYTWSIQLWNLGPAPFHRLTPNKRFEPVFSTVIMAVCSLFNRMLLLTDLIPVHLLYCGQTVMMGCNHTSFEWTRAVRHIYGIIRHMQGLYNMYASIVWPFTYFMLLRYFNGLWTSVTSSPTFFKKKLGKCNIIPHLFQKKLGFLYYWKC